jgi:hypothetical protein
MHRFQLFVAAITALFVTASTAAAQPGQSYPKVRTFSGGYYGPTQAHYQYQRRYGRPWHGEGGLTSYGYGHRGYGHHRYRHHGHSTFGWPTYGSFGFGLPFGTGGFGYSYYDSTSFFGPGFGLFGVSAPPLVSFPLGVAVTPPALTLASPGVYQPFWSPNPLVNDGLLNNGQLWQQEVPDLLTPEIETLDVEPFGNAPVLPPSSTPQAQLRSLQQQQQGDLRLRELNYLQAYLRYQEAASTAPDRAEPHYRMGIALAGMKRFDKAVRELKRASDLDPAWLNSVSLDELLGADNQIGKVQLKQRVADWALADAYDADRLYLLGTMLHLDGDQDRARILVDTALALVGQQRHLTAFVPNTQPASESAPALQEPRVRQQPTPQGTDPQPPGSQQPVLPSPGPRPSAPENDDVPAAPQEPDSADVTDSEAEPQEVLQTTPSVDPAVPQPSGPAFPSSLK